MWCSTVCWKGSRMMRRSLKNSIKNRRRSWHSARQVMEACVSPSGRRCRVPSLPIVQCPSVRFMGPILSFMPSPRHHISCLWVAESGKRLAIDKTHVLYPEDWEGRCACVVCVRTWLDWPDRRRTFKTRLINLASVATTKVHHHLQALAMARELKYIPARLIRRSLLSIILRYFMKEKRLAMRLFGHYLKGKEQKRLWRSGRCYFVVCVCMCVYVCHLSCIIFKRWIWMKSFSGMMMVMLTRAGACVARAARFPTNNKLASLVIMTVCLWTKSSSLSERRSRNGGGRVKDDEWQLLLFLNGHLYLFE